MQVFKCDNNITRVNADQNDIDSNNIIELDQMEISFYDGMIVFTDKETKDTWSYHIKCPKTFYVYGNMVTENKQDIIKHLNSALIYMTCAVVFSIILALIFCYALQHYGVF